MAFRLITTRTVLAAGAMATAGLVAACGAGVNNASSNTSLSNSASPTASATATATSSAPAPSTTKVPPHSQTAVAPVPATTTTTNTNTGTGSGATGECQTSALKVTLSGGGGAAGHQIVSIVFTNVGANPCTMISFPGVSYVDSSGRQIGAAAVREGSRGTGVTLRPGQRASAEVSETRVDLYDPGACKKTAAVGLRVYPPHNTQPVTVPQSGAAGCAGSIPGNQLTVQSVRQD